MQYSRRNPCTDARRTETCVTPTCVAPRHVDASRDFDFERTLGSERHRYAIVVVFFTLTDRGPQPYPVIYVVANPACSHKEVPRSTSHIMVTTRYSDQQGSKSRQKVMRLYKQWHRPIAKLFIKSPYSISRAASIDSDYCCLPTTSVLSNKPDKLRSNQF